MHSHRRQVTQFSARWSGGRVPMVVVLIAVNVAAFVLQLVLDRMFAASGNMVPGNSFTTDWFALSAKGISLGYYWQFLTYMFLHAGPLHLLANMLGLYFAGRQVEAVLGRANFLGIFFLGGFVGALAQLGADFIPSGPPAATLVGASAGVLAVVLAFTTMLPELEITALIMFVIPINMRAKFLGWAAMGVSAGLTVLNLAGYPILGIVGHAAHLGGCLAGWAYVKQLGYGNPLAVQRYIFEKRQRVARQERMPPGQFISEEIDPILDKISREGIHSLTRQEKKILERGRDKIAKRTSSSRS